MRIFYGNSVGFCSQHCISTRLRRHTAIRLTTPANGARVLEISQEKIQTLTRLGLTVAQAKAYLTLATLETATAKEISYHSDIAREEVYRLLAALQKKGLIERIISSPTRFKAVPIEQGLSILIKRKEKEISEIKKETSNIIENFKQNNAKPIMDKNAPQFTLIYGKEAFYRKLKEMMKNTEKTIDTICEGCSFARAIFELEENIMEAVRRGVRIRVIVTNPEENKLWRNVVQVAKNPCYNLKTLTVKNTCEFAIFDKKEVIIICFSSKNFAESPFLWSKNANIIKMAQNYFENMWQKSSEYIFRKASLKQEASTQLLE